MDHDLTAEPESKQRQGGILATTVTVDTLVTLKITITKRATFTQSRQHLVDQLWIFNVITTPACVWLTK